VGVLGNGLAGVAGAIALLACTPAARAADAARHDVRAGVAEAIAVAPPIVTVRASPAVVHNLHRVTLAGRATGAPPGSQVRLFVSPYPYGPAKLLHRTTTAANGSFRFHAWPDRNTRYRVVVPATGATEVVAVTVIGKTIAKVRAVPLGQARVTLVVFHPRDLRWTGTRVSWWFATGFHGPYQPEPATRTVRLSRYVLVFSATVTLPAGHYRWRACFHAPQDHALANPHGWSGCTGRGYLGAGSLPEGYPGAAAVARAAGFLASRAGRTAFAVVDNEGRMSGVHEHWTFVSASVVKAMLLVSYLRMLDARGQHDVDAFSNSFLYPMINVSDNSAATQTWSIVGDGRLYALAHAAGMTDFSIVGIWANAQLSAADQAKFFFEMDSLIPREFVGYARYLLSTIAGYESWGIPAVARPLGYQVFFKGGWRGTGLGQLVHQIGRLEGRGRTFSIAVMTDGDPSMGYGIATIEGVTGSLL
jgi:hypothetical protein